MAFIKSGWMLFLITGMQVSGKLHIAYNGQDISMLADPVKVIVGENVLFECTSTIPGSVIIWTKDGTDSSFNHTKEIKDVQVTDEGIYNCQMFDLETETAENKQVTVEVLYPPSYPTVEPLYVEGSYYALHGEYIMLKCQSDAKPEPNYEWRCENTTGPLLTRNAVYYMMVASHIIDYYCIVQNRMVPTLGEPQTTSLTHELQIRVYVMAYILKIEGGTYRNVNEGNNISVSCQAYGIPPPKIWWKKEGDKTFYQENNKLFEATVSQNFAGKYYCNVENTVTASNGTDITTYAKQAVHVYVIVSPTGENNIKNCTDTGNRTSDREEGSTNIALIIFTGIGWLGLVLSGLIHILICTKNRNKKLNKRNMTALNIINDESLCDPHSKYVSNSRLPSGDSSDAYDRIKSTRSFSSDSSTSLTSNLTTVSTVPSFDSIHYNSSTTNLHKAQS